MANYTPEFITSLKSNEVFVFGSILMEIMPVVLLIRH